MPSPNSNAPQSDTRPQDAGTGGEPKASPVERQKFSDARIHLLNPQTISSIWPKIFQAIKSGNPQYEHLADKASPLLLQALSDGRLQYWSILSGGLEEEDPQAIGGLTTNFATDIFYGIKRLWIYSVYIEERFTLQFGGWKSIFESLEQYAKRNSAHEVVGFVHDARLAAAYRRYLGFDTQSFVIKEVKYG